MLLLLFKNFIWAAWWPYCTMLLTMEKAARQRSDDSKPPPSEPPPQDRGQVPQQESSMANDAFMKPEIPEALRELMNICIQTITGVLIGSLRVHLYVAIVLDEAIPSDDGFSNTTILESPGLWVSADGVDLDYDPRSAPATDADHAELVEIEEIHELSGEPTLAADFGAENPFAPPPAHRQADPFGAPEADDNPFAPEPRDDDDPFGGPVGVTSHDPFGRRVELQVRPAATAPFAEPEDDPFASPLKPKTSRHDPFGVNSSLGGLLPPRSRDPFAPPPAHRQADPFGAPESDDPFDPESAEPSVAELSDLLARSDDPFAPG